MCTVSFEKETINIFENKRWWEDVNVSKGFGHPDIINKPDGVQCKPLRFEPNFEAVKEPHIVHAIVENDDRYDDSNMDNPDEIINVDDKINDLQDMDAENESSQHPLDILISMIDEDEIKKDSAVSNIKRKAPQYPLKTCKKKLINV